MARSEKWLRWSMARTAVRRSKPFHQCPGRCHEIISALKSGRLSLRNRTYADADKIMIRKIHV